MTPEQANELLDTQISLLQREIRTITQRYSAACLEECRFYLLQIAKLEAARQPTKLVILKDIEDFYMGIDDPLEGRSE